MLYNQQQNVMIITESRLSKVQSTPLPVSVVCELFHYLTINFISQNLLKKLIRKVIYKLDQNCLSYDKHKVIESVQADTSTVRTQVE